MAQTSPGEVCRHHRPECSEQGRGRICPATNGASIGVHRSCCVIYEDHDRDDVDDDDDVDDGDDDDDDHHHHHHHEYY